MKEGDIAGLALIQKKYGLLGITCENGEKNLVVIQVDSGSPVEAEKHPLHYNSISR
jgi:hypothetical protein